MASFKEIYTAEVERLFGQTQSEKFNEGSIQPVDKVAQEGQPATMVPFSFNGADVFDSTDTMDVLIWVPTVVAQVVEAKALLSFREFFSQATSVASGGGSTSGSGGSSSPTSGSPSTSGSSSGGNWDHVHNYNDPVPGQTTAPVIIPPVSLTHSHDISHTHLVSIPSHQHSTPAHSHDLSYGVFKESMPGSWSVELRIYERSGSSWSQIGSITSGLTSELEEVDLRDYITGPGQYKISLKSKSGQPQGGRLGCDVAGYIVGAIQALS